MFGCDFVFKFFWSEAFFPLVFVVVVLCIFLPCWLFLRKESSLLFMFLSSSGKEPFACLSFYSECDHTKAMLMHEN